MSVPAESFQRWLQTVAPGQSTAAVCRLAGVKKSTLAQQMIRGKVAVASIVAVSRALGLDVLESLCSFDAYRDLCLAPATPTQAELISQVSDRDLLKEILARDEAAETGRPKRAVELADVPHRNSVRTWLDAIGPADLRQRLAAEVSIAPQNLSAQVKANRLTPDLAVRAAKIAGVGLTDGLVATGLLTPKEAGWPPEARAGALSALPTSALVFAAAERLDAAGKALRRMEQDDEAQRAVWEHLG